MDESIPYEYQWPPGLQRLVVSYGRQKVAVESTDRFWIPIHMVLEGTVGVIVANAYKIKHTTKKNRSQRLRMAR